MRVAVLGSRMPAIFAADHFDKMGADVVLFSDKNLGEHEKLTSEYFPLEVDIASFFALIDDLRQRILIKNSKILRVQKRFLHPTEEIQGHTRLYDLFRLVFSTGATEEFLTQLKDNKDLRNSLGDDIVKSLENPIENFMDVDVVIDARDDEEIAKYPMGAGGYFAINEIPLQSSGMIYYGSEGLYLKHHPSIKKIVMVGEFSQYRTFLLGLKDWLFLEEQRQIVVVSYEHKEHEDDFTFSKFIEEIENDYNDRKMSYEKKLREWRDLEEYQKTKIPMPEMPIEKIQFFRGYDVVSLDCLIDHKEIFATLERPDFRAAQTSSQYSSSGSLSGSLPAMLSLKADAIWSLRRPNGKQSIVQSTHLQQQEPGFYQLSSTCKIQDIESDLMKYFSKRGEV